MLSGCRNICLLQNDLWGIIPKVWRRLLSLSQLVLLQGWFAHCPDGSIPLHVLAGELGVNSTQGGRCHHLESEKRKGARDRAAVLTEQRRVGRPARRELRMGVQEDPKSRVEAAGPVGCIRHPREVPEDAPPWLSSGPDRTCFFSLLIEAGARRTVVEEAWPSPGETVEKLEDAGEQGKPHWTQMTGLRILQMLFCPLLLQQLKGTQE